MNNRFQSQFQFHGPIFSGFFIIYNALKPNRRALPTTPERDFKTEKWPRWGLKVPERCVIELLPDWQLTVEIDFGGALRRPVVATMLRRRLGLKFINPPSAGVHKYRANGLDSFMWNVTQSCPTKRISAEAALRMPNYLIKVDLYLTAVCPMLRASICPTFTHSPLPRSLYPLFAIFVWQLMNVWRSLLSLIKG